MYDNLPGYRDRDQRYKTLWYNAQPPDSEDSVAHTVKL